MCGPIILLIVKIYVEVIAGYAHKNPGIGGELLLMPVAADMLLATPLDILLFPMLIPQQSVKLAIVRTENLLITFTIGFILLMLFRTVEGLVSPGYQRHRALLLVSLFFTSIHKGSVVHRRIWQRLTHCCTHWAYLTLSPSQRLSWTAQRQDATCRATILCHALIGEVLCGPTGAV